MSAAEYVRSAERILGTYAVSKQPVERIPSDIPVSVSCGLSQMLQSDPVLYE